MVEKRSLFIDRALDSSRRDGVTIEEFEDLGKELHVIVRFIAKVNRAAVIMDIEDEMSELSSLRTLVKH